MNGSGFARRHLWMALVLAAASASSLVAGADPGKGNGNNNGNNIGKVNGNSADSLNDSDGRVQRGREINPPGVILNLKGKHRGMVWLGSYIVNTSGCADCHTYPTYSPGGDPFRGQPERINAEQFMSGGRQFGPFTAPNLTPDNAGRPAGLTREEFIRTLRTGHNPHDPAGEILQVMPWPMFGKMTNHDLSAIYEYLSALPSLPDNPKPGP